MAIAAAGRLTTITASQCEGATGRVTRTLRHALRLAAGGPAPAADGQQEAYLRSWSRDDVLVSLSFPGRVTYKVDTYRDKIVTISMAPTILGPFTVGRRFAAAVLPRLFGT